MGAYQPDRAHYKDQDHRQDDRVLGDILSFVRPNNLYQIVQVAFILPW